MRVSTSRPTLTASFFPHSPLRAYRERASQSNRVSTQPLQSHSRIIRNPTAPGTTTTAAAMDSPLRVLTAALALSTVGAFIPPATPSGPNKAAASQQAPRAPVARPELVAPVEMKPLSQLQAEAKPGSAAADAEDHSAATLKAMQKFAEKYCEITDTYFCSDMEIAATVIKGLAKHKDELGAPLCPCRHYEDKAAEVSLAYWNCPCVPMRERKECHCMLFLTPENAFAGKEQKCPDELLLDENTQGLN